MYKEGAAPPLLMKKGAPANFLRGYRQISDTENLTEFSFGIVMVNTEKYGPNTDRKYRDNNISHLFYCEYYRKIK